jgi:O-antigen/teichoic acid export membrane protein
MENTEPTYINNTNNTLQTFWVGLGSFSNFALTIVSAAILSRYFDKAEYGTYRQIIYIYNSLLIVFSAGLPTVFSYFLPKYSLGEGKTIVNKITKVLSIFGLLFSSFLFLASNLIASILNNPELAIGLKYFSPIPLFLLPTLGIEGIFSTYKKTMFIALYNIITRSLMLIFIVLPVILFNGNYLDAIYGWIIVSVITYVIAYYFKNIPFRNVDYRNVTLTYKNVFAYSGAIIVASIAGMAIKSADQFYISRYFGPNIFAEYSNGFIELPFVTMITGATSVVIMPIFSKVFHEKKDIKNIIDVWQNVLKKSAMLIYPLVVFFMVYAKEIMILIFSEKYAISGRYFQINLVLNFFNIVILTPLFFSMNKTRLYSNIHIILAIVIWVTEYLTVIIFNDPIAIAFNSTLLNIIKIIYFIYLASKILGLNFLDLFPIISILKLLLHSLLIITLVKIIQDYFIYTHSIIIMLVISASIYLILLLSTSSIFKLNYLETFHPIFDKILKKQIK